MSEVERRMSATKLKAGVAERIASSRRQAGLTQRQVAQRSGVTPGAVGQWEIGATMPSTDNFMRLIRFRDRCLVVSRVIDLPPPAAMLAEANAVGAGA